MTTTKIETVTVTETIHTASGDHDETRTLRVEMPADYDPALVTAEDIEQDGALRVVEPEDDEDDGVDSDGSCTSCGEEEATGRCICGDYVVIAETQADDDLRERAQDHCDAHAPDGVSVWVEALGSRGLRAEGTYRRSDTAGWQILGCSIPVPERVERLLRDAWDHACRG